MSYSTHSLMLKVGRGAGESHTVKTHSPGCEQVGGEVIGGELSKTSMKVARPKDKEPARGWFLGETQKHKRCGPSDDSMGMYPMQFPGLLLTIRCIVAIKSNNTVLSLTPSILNRANLAFRTLPLQCSFCA